MLRVEKLRDKATEYLAEHNPTLYRSLRGLDIGPIIINAMAKFAEECLKAAAESTK